MKLNRCMPAALGLTVVAMASMTASGASLTWDADGTPPASGGAGAWDVNTSALWHDGSADVVWPASGMDNDAVFANTAGTVSLAAGGATVNDLTFNTTGYVIQNNTLTFNGSTATLTVGSGLSATISSLTAGSAALVKAGAGTLTLNCAGGSTFSGNITISAGTLSLSGGGNTYPLGQNGARTITINGATVSAAAGCDNPFGTASNVGTLVMVGGTYNSARYNHLNNVEMTGGTIQPTGVQVDGLDMQNAPTVTIHAAATTATIASKMTFSTATTLAVEDGAASPDLLMSDVLAGGSALTKTGPGMLTLSNNGNTFSGGTTIGGGTLNITVAGDQTHSALGVGRAVTVNSGATLRLGNADALGYYGANPNTLTLNGGTLTVVPSLHDTIGYNGITLNAGTITAEGAGDATGNYILDGTVTVLPNAAASVIDAPKIAIRGGNGSNLSVTFNVADGAAATDLSVSSALTITTPGGVRLGASGAGTVVLGGTCTGTGARTAGGGPRDPGATAASAPANNLVSGSSALVLGGGTLNLAGKASTSNAQTFNGTTLNAGVSAITLVSGASGSLTLNLGALTRTGGTVDFTLPASGSITTTTGNSNGILGPWATIGSNFAMNDGTGKIVASSNYGDIPARGPSTIADDATLNVRINSAGTSGNIALAAATTTINTLLQNTGTAATVDTAGKTLRVGSIMVGSGQEALTVGAAAGDGSLTAFTAGGELDLINAGGNALTINAVIANNSSASTLVKTGSGIVVLAGANTYSGTTTLGAGTLRLGSATALGTGALTIVGGSLDSGVAGLLLSSNNAQSWNGDFGFVGTQSLSLGTGAVTLSASRTVTVSASTLTVGGTVSGSGLGLTKAGNGTLTLAGTLAYTGATTANGGTLRMDHGTSTGNDYFSSSSLSLASGATFEINQTSGNARLSSVNRPISGAGTFSKTGGGLTWLANDGGGTINTFSLSGGGLINVQGGTLASIKTAAANLGGLTVVSGASATLDNSATQGGNGWFDALNGGGSLYYDAGTTARTITIGVNGGGGSYSGVLSNGGSGAVSLVKTGAGTQTLTAKNTLSGTVTVKGGALNLGYGGNDGTGTIPGSLTVTNATVNVTAENALYGYNGTAATVTLNAGGTLNLNANNKGCHIPTLTLNGGTLSSASTPDPTWGGWMLDGIITAGGPVASTIGASQMVLYNGAIRTVTVNSGATLNITGTFAGTANALNTGGLIKAGAGTLSLSGANAYKGGTTLNAGTLVFGSTAAIGTGALTINGGTLDSAVAGLVNASNNPQSWNGDFAFAGTQSLNLGTGAVTLAATRQVTVTAGTLTVGGAVSGSGLGLTKAGAGTLTLTGAASYTGATTVSGGTLLLDHGSATGNDYFAGNSALDIAAGATFTVNQAANNARYSTTARTVTGAGTFAKTGAGLTWVANDSSSTITTFNLSAGGLINVQGGTLASPKTAPGNLGGLTIAAGAVVSLDNAAQGADAFFDALNGGGSLYYEAGSTPRTLTLGANGGSGAFSGIISNGGSGAVALTKNGAGTQALSGANTYTGNTTVGGGTLLVNGTHAAAAIYNVSAGVLGGTGTVSSVVNVFSGATLAPGGVNATGRLTVQNNVVLSGGATVDIDIRGTSVGQAVGGYDQLLIGAGKSLTLGDNIVNLTVRVPAGTTLPYNHTFTIVSGSYGGSQFKDLREDAEILEGGYGFIVHYGVGVIQLTSRKVDHGALFTIK